LHKIANNVRPSSFLSANVGRQRLGGGLKPANAIVRAYDPWADHYTGTGEWLFVNRDRHLMVCWSDLAKAVIAGAHAL